MVIGIGNRWRGDDAAGLAVAGRLRELGADARELEGEPAALIEAFAEADAIVIVDAASSGAPPGTVRRFDARSGPLPSHCLRSSTHALGVPEAVELARALGRLPARLEIFAIEGARFTTGAPLSPPVERAVHDLAASLAARP
jgi:hydrogenase maturation protease